MEMPISKESIESKFMSKPDHEMPHNTFKIDKDEDIIPADNTSQLQLATVKMQETSLTSFVLRNQWLSR